MFMGDVMKCFLSIFLLNSIVFALPYVKKYWKPLQFEREKETFDRNNLIPVDQGEYNFAQKLPERSETFETIITAGNINPSNVSFVNKELSADNVIPYLKDPNDPKNQNVKINPVDSVNVYINPIRRIRDI